MSDLPRDTTVRVSEVRTPKQKLPPAAAEDWVRAALAIFLFVLLAVEICSALFVVVFCTQTADRIENLKSVLTLVLSPTVALFGAATGFYYGTKSETKS